MYASASEDPGLTPSQCASLIYHWQVQGKIIRKEIFFISIKFPVAMTMFRPSLDRRRSRLLMNIYSQGTEQKNLEGDLATIAIKISDGHGQARSKPGY